jgi:hypothetical protein
MTNLTPYIQGFTYSGLNEGLVYMGPTLQEAPTSGVLPNIEHKIIEIRGLCKSEPKCGSLQLVEL